MTRSTRKVLLALAIGLSPLAVGLVACETLNIGNQPASSGFKSVYQAIADEYAKLHRDDGQRGEFNGTVNWRLEFGPDSRPIGFPAPIGILADSDKPSLSRLPVIDMLFNVGQTRQFRWDITKPRSGQTVAIRTDATFSLTDAVFTTENFWAEYSFSGVQYVFDDPNDVDDIGAAIEEYSIGGTLLNQGFLSDADTLQFSQFLWQKVTLEFLTPMFEIDVEYFADAPLKAQ